MKLTDISYESIGGGDNLFICGDNRTVVPELSEKYRGQIQTAYIDPPFGTGRTFAMRMRVGEAGYRLGKPCEELTGYADDWAPGEYMAMMGRAVEGIYAMLKDEGSFFLHVDSRMHAPLRLLCDDIFGLRNFVNEIVWAYRSGGIGDKAFAKKHDIILFYRKSKKAYFNIRAVAVPREKPQNHMKSAIDEQGRTYRSIVSAGKEYRYYDDGQVFPSDVWTDIPHIQQRDPSRTGYETQKPEKLLERIILATSKPGDTVLDIFAGSGTTLAVAQRLGRFFVGVDSSPFSLVAARKRVENVLIKMPARPDIIPAAEFQIRGAEITLNSCGFPDINIDPTSLDAVDGWAVGVKDGDTFIVSERSERSRKNPVIKRALCAGTLAGACARITDIRGRNFYFEDVISPDNRKYE